MAFVEKISEGTISVHEVAAVMKLAFINDITNEQAKDFLNTDVLDDTELGELSTHYLALDDAGKADFSSVFESYSLLLRSDNPLIGVSEFKTKFGMS